MKKSKLALLLGTLLSLFVLAGCPGPANSNIPGENPTTNEITNFNVVNTSMYSATITWDKNVIFNKYELTVKKSNGYTTEAQVIINKDDTLPVRIDGLEINTSYTATLWCYENNNYYSKYYTINFKTDATGPVENLIANAENDVITLTWKSLYNSTISRILIYRKAASASEFELLDTITRSTYDTNHTYIDENVTKNETYTYKVVTGTSTESWESEEVTITADFDNLNFTATSIGMREATFEWDADDRFDKFVLYSISTNKKTIIPAEGATVLSETIESLYVDSDNTIYLECYNNDILIKTIRKIIITKDAGPVEGLTSSISKISIYLSWNEIKYSKIKKVKVFRKYGNSFVEIGEQSNDYSYYYDDDYNAGVNNEYKITSYKSDGTEAGSKEITVDASGYCEVVFNYGTYGESQGKKSSVISRCKKGDFIDPLYLSIKSDYSKQIDFLYWSEATEKFDLYSTKITKNIVLNAIYQAKKISNPLVKAYNKNVIINWSAIPDSKYTIKLINRNTNDEEEIPDIEDCKYIFNSLEDGVSYQAAISTKSSFTDVRDSEFVETEVFNLAKPHSEWLVLLYLDGDNDLNDPIYFDLNEAEWGLSQLSSTDDVRILALWDGWDFASNNPKDKVSFFSNESNDSTVHTTASTRLLELGKDSRTLYASNGGIYFTACELSPDTLDLTETVDWIENGEVDMSKRSTLESYLQWVNENFDADKTILQFSNHGGGPRSASMKKGNYGRRSMCWDYSNNGDGDSFLKTSDVSAALSAAGYGADNKLTMIMEDVCLGGSLEETYELKDYAEYYVGSPNNIPGMGFDYKAFVSSLEKNADITTIGSKLVYSYSKDYTMSDKEWNEYFTKLGTTADFVTENGLEEYVSYLNPDCSTLTFVNLSKIGKVKEAVDTLAEIIRDDTTLDNRIKYDVDSDRYYDTNNTNVTIPETAEFVSRKEAVKCHIALYGDPIYYKGSFGCLKDLGYMVHVLNNVYRSTGNIWLEVYNQTNAVETALKDAIVACWRDGYKKASYYKSNSGFVSSYASSLYGYGLTINCSVWVPHTVNKETLLYEDFEDWYKEELSFGRDCSNWAALIEEWFKITE